MPFPVALIAGSLHYDIMVEADHLPRLDETAVGKRWYPKFGGKGGNQAVSAVRQGACARMVGAVGDDDFGRFLRKNLQAGGVDDSFVRLAEGVGSGMSVALMDTNGDYAAAIVSGANLTIGPLDVAGQAVWQQVGLLILQNEIPEAANIAAAAKARELGIRILLNAAPYRPMSRELTALVDILVVNAVEAEMMGAEKVCCLPSAANAARKLAERFETVIVTAGARGLAAFHATDRQFSLPAEPAKVVSSHGAGDAFVGALAAALLTGAEIETACRAASIAASRHVEGLI
jgi:ribokinase